MVVMVVDGIDGDGEEEETERKEEVKAPAINSTTTRFPVRVAGGVVYAQSTSTLKHGWRKQNH